MSSNIDPNAMAGAPPPEAAPPANPFESWGQVFTDPGSVNPYELHQTSQWVEALRGEGTHEQTLEQALRDWQYLQPDESLQDLMGAIEQQRSARNDPFAAMRAAQPDPEQLAPGFDPDDYGAAAGMPDPEMLRQVWQQDMQEYMRKEREELMAEQRSMQITGDLTNQLNVLAVKEGLDATDREELWTRVQNKINAGQVRADQLGTLVADTNAEWNAYIDGLLNKRMSGAPGGSAPAAPAAPAPGGAVPTTVPPVTSIRSLAEATMQRVREADGAQA